MRPHEIKKGWGKYCSWICRRRPDLSQRNKTADYSKRKPLPQVFKKGSVSWNKGKSWSESTVQKIRVARAKQKFLNIDTDIEIIMKNALDKHGLKYEHPFQLDGIFNIDFAMPDKKIAIECDGLYWHSRQRNQSYDKRKEQYLIKRGWTLLRFLDILIKQKIEKCISVIKSVMCNR